MSEATAIEKAPAPAAIEKTPEERNFELAQRQAQAYAQSTLVPETYRGNVGNVLIAMNMASRMGADVLMVMQNLYLVHGKPGWSAAFLIACFNTGGKFSAIKYRFEGEPFTNEWGCQAYATELATGEEIAGTWVTWDMAKQEGWATKAGSKWKTMPEQMFRYRSAAFFIRATAPEIGMGLHTREELEDIAPANGNGDTEQKSGISGLKSRLNVIDQATEVPASETVIDGSIVEDGEPDVTHTDAQIDEPEETPEAPEMDKAESKLEDLRTAAIERYRELTTARKGEAAKWLGTRELKKLKRDELEQFLDTFAS
jgi:hypothetical protein